MINNNSIKYSDSYDNDGFVPENINNCSNVPRETKSESD